MSTIRDLSGHRPDESAEPLVGLACPACGTRRDPLAGRGPCPRCTQQTETCRERAPLPS